MTSDDGLAAVRALLDLIGATQDRLRTEPPEIDHMDVEVTSEALYAAMHATDGNGRLFFDLHQADREGRYVTVAGCPLRHIDDDRWAMRVDRPLRGLDYL